MTGVAAADYISTSSEACRYTGIARNHVPVFT